MALKDVEKSIEQLSATQQEVIDVLTSSYDRYNKLVDRLIEVTNHDYASIYALKKAILVTLSESLHGIK